MRRGGSALPVQFRYRLGHRVAAWLTEHYSPTTGREAFRQARLAEFLAHEYPDEFWQPVSIHQDLTRRFTPLSCAEMASFDPRFFDSHRRPSLCRYGRTFNSYSTPDGFGTEDQPSPGWSGSVEDEVFRDQFFANRNVVFRGGSWLDIDDPRPLVIDVAYQVTANASFRGHRMWFTPLIYMAPSTGWWLSNFSFYWWYPHNLHRYLLPPENLDGWSHVHEGRRSFLITPYRGSYTYRGRDYIHIIFGFVPGTGRYFSRNDWVDVRWTGDFRCFYARV